MFRGGAAVAVPSSRPVGKLTLQFQQANDKLQKAIDAEVEQKWSQGMNGTLPSPPHHHRHHQEAEEKPKEAPKPENKWTPQWKTKLEPDKKPELEKKTEPLWRRRQEPTKIQEPVDKPEQERKQEAVNKIAPGLKQEPVKKIMEPPAKPEPVKKLEPVVKQVPVRKTEQEVKQEPVRKIEPLVKQEPARGIEPIVKQEPVRKMEPLVKQEPARKIEPLVRQEPVRKMDPQVKQESARKLEPLVKQEPTRKTEPLVKQEPARKIEPLVKQEPVRKIEPQVKQEPARKIEPLVKLEPVRKIEPQVKQEPVRKMEPIVKQEPVKKTEPLVKEEPVRKTEPLVKREPVRKVEPLVKQEPTGKVEPLVKQEPVRKIEPLVKQESAKKIEQLVKQESARKIELVKQEPERKLEPLIKQEPEKKVEPVGKIEPPWKRKPKPENRQEPEARLEPLKKAEPMWGRKREPEKSAETERKPEERVRPTGPLWKRKTQPEKKPEPEKVTELERKLEPQNRDEPNSQPQERVRKPEPLWKRKFEPEKKAEPNKGKEPEKKTEPLWKRKLQKDDQKETNVVLKPESEQGSEDLSDEDETEELLCPLCFELYNEEVQEPVPLPRCGHVFCRACLFEITQGKGKGHFPCPTCRKRHLKPAVEDLPVDKEVLSRAVAFSVEQLGTCQTHQEPLMYWCRTCQVTLCPSCRVKKGHDVVRAKVVLQEKRKEMKERGEVILDNVVQEKRKILDSVKTYSMHLLQVCEESTVVDDSSQDVKDMLADTKQTADLSFVMNSLKRMKSILGHLSKAGSDTEAEVNKTPKVRRRKERHTSQENSVGSRGEADKHSQKQMNGHVVNKSKALNPAENKKVVQARQEKGSGTGLGHKTTEVSVAHSSQQEGKAGLRGSMLAEMSNHGPLLQVVDPSLWPLTCCVYGEDGRRAQLAWEGGKLHMSALGDQVDAAHFMIKLSVIQSVIPPDQPEVFMEIGVGERRFGRVYMRLWGHLRRAQHFLALCMGTHGPSYRGAKFEEVYSRGMKGECLHGGPYLTPSGDLSAQGVMDALEWDGHFKAQQRQGLVVGAGSGRPDRDSCFDICTIENPTRNFACPFGEVVAGWDAVMAVIDYRPVRAVTIQDVGVVVPDLTRPHT